LKTAIQHSARDIRGKKIATLSSLKHHLAISLIFKMAGISAAFGPIPVIDAVVCAVLNDCLVLLIHSIVGSEGEIRERNTVIAATIRGLLLAGNALANVLRIVAYGFEMSLLGLLIGQSVSVGINFSTTVATGLITLHSYKTQKQKNIDLFDDRPEY